ncbi:TOMM precursor leader peptide-binding protein [Streptomyces sp. LP05-1]|uniref:TOMM leader peptide-binding protein n=1 Tax=Streptomyces pyxinae TaxID=2970734 RepID=A0ABT2CAG8_9ACTN|nr:TOMM precursor leader peptide-binding protein [Streptomyces sp. LP05-1]MCS0634392.1 TOMM precursor leader peptide-binding protein [Streptomyces sp. LP05-1]
MHPRLKPALRSAWRSLQQVQFGITPAHSVLLGPVDTTTGSLLSLLDGTRGPELLREAARKLRLPDGRLELLLDRLAAAGLLDDPADGDPAVIALRERPEADRLRSDLASLSVVHREPGAAGRRLAARRELRVQVRGAGRVGAAVAALLSAAGVGRVDVLDGGRVRPWEVSPGGLPGDAVGERRDTAARRLVGRSAPGGRLPRAAPEGAGRGAGSGPLAEPGLALVVVAPRDGIGVYAPDSRPAEDWMATGTPQLYAGVAEATAVVGPLVLPGGTACARCLELERADRDPSWPRLVAQWRSGLRELPPPCDVALASAVAGLAAAHALAFLDGDLPASTGARWEASLPLLEWRSERLAPHPECRCGAAGRAGGEEPGAAPEGQDTMGGTAVTGGAGGPGRTRQGSQGLGGAYV